MKLYFSIIVGLLLSINTVQAADLSQGQAYAHYVDGKVHLMIGADSLDHSLRYQVRVTSQNGKSRIYTIAQWQSSSLDFSFDLANYSAADTLEIFWAGQWRRMGVGFMSGLETCRAKVSLKAVIPGSTPGGYKEAGKILTITNPCSTTIYYRLARNSMPFSSYWEGLTLAIPSQSQNSYFVPQGKLPPAVEQAVTIAYYQKLFW